MVRGCVPLVSLVTDEPAWWCQFPPPSPIPSPDILPTICYTGWGIALGPCFRHVSSPHPLDHWCLCCWFWALSLLLRLGKDMTWRPVGCSPTPCQTSDCNTQWINGCCFKPLILSVSSVQSLSHFQLFATPWTAACQASLSITNI